MLSYSCEDHYGGETFMVLQAVCGAATLRKPCDVVLVPEREWAHNKSLI